MPEKEEEVSTSTFQPTKKEVKIRTGVYDDIDHMITQRDRSWRQFTSSDGDRTLTEYINDSDRRLNGYTLTREEQDKEDWQENVFNPVTRRKLKAIVAGVALNVPDLAWKATNKQNILSAQRAEFMKQAVRHSRIAFGNPQMDIFFEAWECAGKGTVVKYDGYLKTKFKRKFIKGFNLETGEVEFDEREEIVDDKPIDIQVPLSEFFIWDFYIPDVQDQPKVAWIQNYNKDQLEQEFGQYKNFKHVKDASSVQRFQQSVTTTYFYDRWKSRVEDENDFEVIRYYNTLEDRYEIWANGVPLLLAPLLWGKAKKKMPFSKTIFEPFDGRAYFYGKSLPSVIEGNQDIDNTAWNSILDKFYRSLKPPMLVGLVNKDLLDIEDEFVNEDDKIYVPDVNQVKPMPFKGVDVGDVSMLQLVSQSIDESSVSVNQTGAQGTGVTAREVLIANENAKKLKGIFFMFLEDLWMQKTRLRVLNILMNYTRPQMEAVIGKDGKEIMTEVLKTFNIEDTEFSDGSRGTLQIAMASEESLLPSVTEIEATENAMEEQGINFKMIAMKSDYLDDWEFDFNIMPNSLFVNDQITKDAEISEKHSKMAAFFPRWFAANERKNFAEFVDVFGETIEEYQEPPAPPAPEEEAIEEGSPLAEGAELETEEILA